LFLLGWQRLGRLIRFIPFPVVAGFLASTGWLLLTGAVSMTIGAPLSWKMLPSLMTWQAFVMPGLTILWAAALWFMSARWKHPLFLPLALIAATLATHTFLAVFPGPEEPGTPSALMFSLQDGGVHPVFPLLTGDFLSVEWAALAPVVGDMVAVTVMAILSILLNSTSIELATGVDIDLDRELRVQGLANIASAVAGGFVGHTSVSRTLVNIAAGGTTRLAGVVVGLVALSVLISGGQMTSYIPRFVLGGLLLQLGARLIWDSTRDPWRWPAWI
jgi:SulP family sulfate permease